MYKVCIKLKCKADIFMKAYEYRWLSQQLNIYFLYCFFIIKNVLQIITRLQVIEIIKKNFPKCWMSPRKLQVLQTLFIKKSKNFADSWFNIISLSNGDNALETFP